MNALNKRELIKFLKKYIFEIKKVNITLNRNDTVNSKGILHRGKVTGMYIEMYFTVDDPKGEL